MSGLRTLLRFVLLRRHRSKVPTGFVPLSDIRSVAVLRDPREYAIDAAVNGFFGPYGIKVKFLSTQDKDLRTDEDLFITLLPLPDIDERYAAVSSTARFKVGTHTVGKNVLDLVVSATEGGDARQVALFEAVTSILTKIQ